MAHETVPADIAAAIEAYNTAAHRCGMYVGRPEFGLFSRASEMAKQALNATILHHLRAYDEMKAALEAQTSGGA